MAGFESHARLISGALLTSSGSCKTNFGASNNSRDRLYMACKTYQTITLEESDGWVWWAYKTNLRARKRIFVWLALGTCKTNLRARKKIFVWLALGTCRTNLRASNGSLGNYNRRAYLMYGSGGPAKANLSATGACIDRPKACTYLTILQEDPWMIARFFKESDTRFLTPVFLWIGVPQAPEYPIRIVSTFFENSRDNREWMFISMFINMNYFLAETESLCSQGPVTQDFLKS